MANKKISELPYISNGDIGNLDLVPLVTYFSSVTGDTVHTYVSDLQSYILSATPTSYSSFTTLILNSGLTQGSFYLINDFRTCYDQPNFDVNDNPIVTGNYKQGPIEPILVLATSNSTISQDAYQPNHPNDKIKYDWTWNLTEVTSGTSYGRITERIDEFNNRTDYDHRNILFKRYRLYTYRDDLQINGTIDLLPDGSVSGNGTYFTALTVGDVIYISSANPPFYEITGITDNTNMSVSGDTIAPVSSSNFYKTIEESNGSGYFSYKQTNVKTNDYLEYTTFGDALSNSYAKNNYIGNFANNYQNVGSTIFLLSNNVFLEGEYESNKFGEYCYDNTFGTDNQNNIWGDYCFKNVSTNDIDECSFGDYFNSNLINSNLSNCIIGDVFEYNGILGENGTNFRNNTIGNNFRFNKIYSDFYENNILYDFNNNIIGDFGNLDNLNFYRNYIRNNFNRNTIKNVFQNNQIGTNFQENEINGEFVGNTILNGFNRNTIGTYFSLNSIGNGFNNNIIYDNFERNSTEYYFSNNEISNDFANNTIGTYFTNNNPSNNILFGWGTLSTVSTRTYGTFFNSVGNGALGYRILGKEFVMFVTATSQYFKIKFSQWTQGGSGGGFKYTRQEIDSAGNSLGPVVTFTKTNYGNEIDVIVPGVVEITRGVNNGIYNIVSEGSWNNGVSPSGTSWNSVYTEPNNGKRFSYNKIGNEFYSNTIGNDFGYGGSQAQGNIINDSFQNNIIGQYMYNNVIGNYFTNNSIGDNFENNTIKNFFLFNQIDSDFENNEIGDYFGNFGKTSNVIGKIFQNNKIGNFFGNDQAGAGGNTISGNFNGNTIKNYFNNNVIESYFENNIIGNYFGGPTTSNIIGGYFRNNKIGNFFGNDGNGGGGNRIAVINTMPYTSLSGTTSGITLTNGGTGYIDSTNVTTTGGLGTSLTVDIFTDGLGVITGVTINNPGTYYTVGDTITITTGGNDATFNITGVTSFVPGDVIDNGFGATAEIVTDDGVSAATINVIMGGSINGLLTNNNGVAAYVTGTITTPYVSGFTQGNVIGDYFLRNQIGNNFENNQIGNYFGNDMTTDMSNIILDNFKSNIIGNYFGIDVETPSTGEGGNIIRNNFIGNTIGDSFTYNITYDTSGGGYYNNTIGWGCNTNTFGDGFNYNRIGDLFQENLLGVYFGGNEIGYFFNLNEINDNAGFNKIGDLSWFNTISTGFESNNIGDSFFANTIGIDFAHNTIGNFFGQFFVGGNTWGDNVYDNRFGDHTYGNDVLSNFNNNNIFNNFIGNIVGDDFQYNVIQYDCSVDFTANPATHVYSSYSCTIFANSTPTLRLSYFDTLDNLVITNPDL